MNIEYIRIANNKNINNYKLHIYGTVDAERLIPIIQDDCIVLEREPLIGDKRSRKLYSVSSNYCQMACSLDVSDIVGERLVPCPEESNEDRVVFYY